MPSIYSSARTELAKLLIYGLFRKIRVLAQDEVVICMVTTRPPKTIVKPTALGPVANTDTKLLIYGLFQKGRVLAQDGILRHAQRSSSGLAFNDYARFDATANLSPTHERPLIDFGLRAFCKSRTTHLDAKRVELCVLPIRSCRIRLHESAC